MAQKVLQTNFDVDYVVSYRMPKDGTDSAITHEVHTTDSSQTKKRESRSSRSSFERSPKSD